jgi:hypothetical protein
MMQPCASGAQVVTVLPAEQNVPAWPVVQALGTALHEQVALPAAPVHVWLLPQGCGVPVTKKQAPSVEQVSSLPLPSQNWPATLQPPGLHWHSPVVPLHVWCALQPVVLVIEKQPFASFVHTDELPLLQKGPGAVQPAGGALHAQAPTPGLPEHAWLPPQFAVAET